MKDKAVQVRVDLVTLDRLKEAAEKEDRSVSALLRRIVREWLDRQEKKR